MDLVVSNQKLSDDFYLMTVSKHFDPEREPLPRMGQFFMVRAWEDYPLLSRPLSIYDSVTRGHQTEASFLYSIVGKGTEIFGALKSGDSISIGRALGNAFPLLNGKVALVGGGAGIAPLHLAALSLKKTALLSIHTSGSETNLS
ncbi:hypothetical protein AGMMS49957_05810 [Synergistales bacterium]|nr:hypothetical protein AGMMS49957_05810 [Synergistales bacterium]